jgi:pimeloyl-ACP methyl ester carboxylesterase
VSAGRVEGAGVALAYEESGKGEPVVLIHGTASNRSVWRETVAELGGDLRAITYDRRAYGESEAPEPYGGTTVGEQAEDAARLIEGLEAAPAVLCGHELGAVIGLDLLRRHPHLVRAAVLIEPPLLALHRSGPETIGHLREAIEAGARERGSAGAVEAFLEATGGRGVLERLGPERSRAARRAARAFVADFAAGPAWSFSRRELRGIEAPVIVLTGSRSSWVRREVSDALAGLLGTAALSEVEGGHFLPLDAPEAVAAAVRSSASA